MNLSPQGRRLLGLLYVAALVIFLDQALDLVASVWPMRFGTATWRFGTFGLGLGRLEFLALADAMAVATAIWLEHRRVLVWLGIIHLLVGVFLAAGIGLFVLDGLQVRRLIRRERVGEFDLAALRSLLGAGAACLACLALSIGVWRTRQIEAKAAKSREGILVTGGGGRPARE